MNEGTIGTLALVVIAVVLVIALFAGWDLSGQGFGFPDGP